MREVLIFVWIYCAMVATSFWEAYVEGRNAWDKGKIGWKLKLGKFKFSGYHFFLFWIMFPLLLTLPLIINGWDYRLFGMIISAYLSGMVIEDFMWYVVNPKVKFKEFFSTFSDYYPWIRFKKHKIIPIGYIVGILVSVLVWYFVWR
jgi:hypothetical protein